MAKPKITRIKAGDSKTPKEKSQDFAPESSIKSGKKSDKVSNLKNTDKKALRAEKRATKKAARAGKKPFILFRPFVLIGRYFANSWREIRQVRWPNRKATWKMVIAVLIYTVFFVILLVLLDALFSLLFNKILG